MRTPKKQKDMTMKKKIKRLPDNAIFNHRNGFGEKVYHTDKRVYTFKRVRNFGKLVNVIFSYTKNEYYND